MLLATFQVGIVLIIVVLVALPIGAIVTVLTVSASAQDTTVKSRTEV